MDLANQAMPLPGADCQTLGELLAQRAADSPGAVAFSCGEESMSYARLDALSAALAHWLARELACEPGTRIALQLPNRLSFPVLAMAVFKAALVLVNISARASAGERDAMLRDSGARILFCQAQGAVAVQVPGVLVFDAAQAVEQAAGRAARKQDFWLPGTRRTLALLQYTGGSSGFLKAAMLTHGNLLANLGQLQQRLGAVYPAAGACMLAPLPFSHIYAMTLGMLGGIAHGHHTVLVPDAGDVQALLAAIQAKACQGIFGIDSLYRRLCAHPGMRRVDFSALRIASAGGMPLSGAVSQRWQALTACALTEGYGLTECSPLVTCNLPQEGQPRSQGRALAGTGIRIHDSSGAVLPHGAVGEVRIKGPQVMQGYWQRPSETARAFDSEGWLRTGDVGMLDAAGYLYLCGRSTDLVIVSGFKVWPHELEDCLLGHPGVQDACVLGHGPESRQELVAFVVAEAGLSAAALRSWCAETLAAYKVPRRIEFMSRLPRNSAGKLQRQRLQALLADF